MVQYKVESNGLLCYHMANLKFFPLFCNQNRQNGLKPMAGRDYFWAGLDYFLVTLHDHLKKWICPPMTRSTRAEPMVAGLTHLKNVEK